MAHPTVDESLDRLHRAGWSIGDAAFGPEDALVWLVTGSNGENVVRAEGRTRAEAYGRACLQAREVGMLAPPREYPMPRRVDERLRLLHGPYRPPALHVGDRATCLYRDCDVIVTSWTDAPISWPRCRRTEGRGHPSLLVDEELIRAIRSEGAATIEHWWGASHQVVGRWRRAFGVGLDNPGTVHLIRKAAQKGADALHELAAKARREGLPAAKNLGRRRR